MMRLLLDTHALIWHFEKNESLGRRAKTIIGDSKSHVFVSVASLWEMAIKNSLGKIRFGHTLREIYLDYIAAGADILPVSPEHAMAVEGLPWHHRDPFDRMLIAQAMTENLTLVTRDAQFDRYDVRIIW